MHLRQSSGSRSTISLHRTFRAPADGRQAPPGTGTIQAEVHFPQKYKPFVGSPDAWIEQVIGDLRRCGLLRENDRILSKKTMLLRYANIIFGFDRAALSKRLGYMWTDEGLRLGRKPYREPSAPRLRSAGLLPEMRIAVDKAFGRRE